MKRWIVVSRTNDIRTTPALSVHRYAWLARRKARNTNNRVRYWPYAVPPRIVKPQTLSSYSIQREA